MSRHAASMGSGTATSLALNAFRSSVERKRTIVRGSELSPPGSRSSMKSLPRGSSRSSLVMAKPTPGLGGGGGADDAAVVVATGVARRSVDESTAYLRRSMHNSRAPSLQYFSFFEDPSSPVASDLMQSMVNASPGSYPDDDGSSDIGDRYNFYAHGRRFLFATSSLGVLDESSGLRQRVIWLVTSRLFDQMVLLLILANTITLAIVDLRHVDANGDPESRGSLRNTVANYADTTFTVLFAAECTLKIIAMGFIGERGAYLMDPWNWIDFLVVSIGIITTFPGIPSVSGMKALRVMRPLRFLNAVPGIKKLVTALLKSIPELLTVVAFVFFLFFLYGVIGVQLWSGVMHARCRLSPFPLQLDPALSLAELPAYQAAVLANVSQFPCEYSASDGASGAIPTENATWSHDTSPWRTPRMCFWPVADESPAKLCSLSANYDRQCPAGQTCGSDYDRYGNFRFTHPSAAVAQRVIRTADFNADLNYGFTSFDHIGQAAVVLFICLPREGWTDIMAMLQDAGYGTTAAIYFISFVLLGSFFILNLALAVIWENFSDASLLEAEERKTRQEISLSARKLAMECATPPQSRVRAAVRAVVQHWVFNVVRIALILVNTVMLSLDQYPIDHELSAVVDTLNFALTFAFILESVLKIVGLGWTQWAADRYNIFDALLVLLALIEIGVSPPAFLLGSSQDTESTVSSFTGLRSFRIFTLFKLARSWPSLQKLLLTILSTIQEIGNFSVLLLLFMYVYALVGMQMFGNQFRFDADGFPVSLADTAAYVPRSNFDTILWSMVTIFQVLTGENWNEVFLNGWRSTGWASTLYFLSLVICGNFIILNLFLAILLSNFEDREADGPHFLHEKEELRRKSRVAPMHSASMTVSVTERRNTRESSRVSCKHQRTTGRRRSSIVRHSPNTADADDNSGSSATGKSKALPPFASTHRLPQMGESGADRKADKPPQRPTGRSLFLLGPYNPIRTNAWAIVHHPYFDRIVLVLIAASTVSVALDNPLNSPESSFVGVLGWVDFTLTIFFLTEVVLKVLAQGLYFNPSAYLRNNWNLMDFVITAIAVPGLQGGATTKVLSGLRTFRALRPLRLINRNPGLKLVVSSLFASIPQMVNVLMVCLLLLTIFSIIAVNNLKGRLYSCKGPAFDALSAQQQALVTYPRVWSDLALEEQQWFNASTAATYGAITAAELTSRHLCGFLNSTWGKTLPQNFDNVLLALRTFFEISTTEGWVTLMLASVDATAIDMQPVANYREGWALFFIAFIFLGSFFIIQLFIGVVIENFNKMKEKLDGTFMLSGSQREWLMISEAILNLRPQRKQRMPRDHVRRWCFRHAKSSLLETVAMGCIILNTFMMGLSYFGQEDLYQTAIDNSNYFFTLVFAVEAAIKVIGLGRYYWKDSWNIFDFVVVVGSCFGIVFTWAGGKAVGTLASTIRSVRVARLIKLIQTAPSLRQLVNTLIITLPSLVSVGGFLSLVFFIYAAMGVQLFAKVKFGELVTPHANFQTIGRAMVTLFRCATGERWNDLMHELADTTDCVVDPPFDAQMCGFSNSDACIPLNGCGTQIAFAYFCSFTMLVTFVLLNIVIAVILEGFANEKDRASGVLLPQHYENFVATWAVFDPDATGCIEWHLLPKLLQQLDEPLGFGPDNEASVKEMTTFIEFLDISVYNGNRVFFSDVARKLGKFVLDVVNEAPVADLPSTIEIDQKWRTLLKGSKIRKLERMTYRLNHIHAVTMLHDTVKSLIFRDELRARVQKFADLTHAVLHAEPQDAGATDDEDSGDNNSMGERADEKQLGGQDDEDDQINYLFD